MKYTNHHGLPEVIVRAVTNDPYTKGASDYSVTELLKPPRQAALQLKHRDEITEDVSDRIWSLFGQLGHTLLERAGSKNEITERRFFGKFPSCVISAQVDSLSLENGVLSDWKFTSSYSFKYNGTDKPEWIAQLNMQLELLRMNGLDAKTLQIGAILRDWSKLQAGREPDYPQKSVIAVPIEIWDRKKTVAFMADRVAMHSFARTNKLPDCSKEDRWARDTKWALMVKGKVRATKLFATKAECELAMDYVKDSYIEERPGVNVRCESYCSVSKYCDQYQKITQTRGA